MLLVVQVCLPTTCRAPLVAYKHAGAAEYRDNLSLISKSILSITLRMRTELTCMQDAKGMSRFGPAHLLCRKIASSSVAYLSTLQAF
jgi:hypothetical protein